MKVQTSNDVETLEKPRTKEIERDCPRCHYVIRQNEKEECYECENCGYIDCGDD